MARQFLYASVDTILFVCVCDVMVSTTVASNLEMKGLPTSNKGFPNREYWQAVNERPLKTNKASLRGASGEESMDMSRWAELTCYSWVERPGYVSGGALGEIRPNHFSPPRQNEDGEGR